MPIQEQICKRIGEKQRRIRLLREAASKDVEKPVENVGNCVKTRWKAV